MLFHFAESAGPKALAALDRLRQVLLQHPDCLQAELLVSTRQADLYLLMSKWRAEPQLDLPAQVKAWTFRTAISDSC